MTLSDPVQVILACATVPFVVGIVLYVSSAVVSRFVFGGYIKERHPDLWQTLASADALAKALAPASDVSDAMHMFRAQSRDDRGDPEIKRPRQLCRYLARGSALSMALSGVLAVAAFIVAAIANSR